MGVIFVARSAKFGKWASDVGLSKNVFKVGYSEEDPKAVIEQGWGGETDWTLLRQRDAENTSEEQILQRLARKEKLVDPNYYPRLRGATGIFKVSPEHVENHILVARVMGGGSERLELKVKPADFADYLIHNAIG
jgi:hypothetical protein